MTKESIFYQRLYEQVKANNKSFNQVERELGYPRNALSNYKYGTEPSGPRLIEIADYFKVSPEYLIGKVKKNENDSLQKKFHRLDAKQKRELYTICQEWGLSELLKDETNNQPLNLMKS